MTATVTCSCGWTKVVPGGRARDVADRHVCRQKKGARRATRRYRCARCGLEATYEHATATEGRLWFSRHSCRKREEAMLRTAFHEQRLAAVDRTPKPCNHKVANHQHGTRACYVLDQCRCEPCSAANSKAETGRERLKAYGRYHKYVDAYPVRLHLAELAEYGIGLKTVAKLSGVSNGALTKIVYGTYATTGTGKSAGRHGTGEFLRGPARRVLRRTAERIYSIEPIPANLPPNVADHERTPLARLHLRALVALGWSMSKLGNRLGIGPSNMGPVAGVHGEGRVLSRATVDKIEALFAELCMTPPPEGNHRDRIAASRSRRFAKERGWLPPLALGDMGDLEADDTPSCSEPGCAEEVYHLSRRSGLCNYHYNLRRRTA